MALDLLQKLKNGENIYGTCIVSTSPIWSKVVNKTLIDFVFLDTEHIPLDRTELTFLCQTYTAKGIAPIVRISSPDPYLACMAKDAGAIGVLAPYIEKTKQIKDIVGATKYRPLKGERLQNVLNAKEELNVELLSYLNNYNKGSLCLINIESTKAVEQLDKLLDEPGLDGIIIGPHDLSINMGIPEQYEHPEFEKTVKQIISKTRTKGLSAGIHFPSNPERQINWFKEGANIIMHSSDMFLFQQKIQEDLAQIRKAVGDDSNKMEGSDLAI